MARRLVALLVAALVAYFGIIGYRGFYLLGQRSAELKVLGLAVLALPVVGAWVVIAELRFGRGTERLAARLDAEGAQSEPELPRTASGRVERRAADELFALRRAEVEQDPQNWRGWYRLALAYDLAGDRRRARSAMRSALDLADA
jgi:Flp pilus assembly protein TadD